MVNWYLVRHGQTEFNREHRVQGQDETSLDEEGLAQAGKLRDRLAAETFAAAWSSDLVRAQQMARTILGDRTIALNTSPDLRELDYGAWDGMTIEEVRAKYNDEFNRIMNGDHDFAPPGGESVTQLLERTGRFVEQASGQVKQGNLLVVCHGGPLRGLAVHLLKLPVSTFWSLRVDLASLSIVEVYPKWPVLALFNDTSHLRCAL